MRKPLHPRRGLRAATAATAAGLLLAALSGCAGKDDSMSAWSADGGKEHTAAIGADIGVLIAASPSGSAAEECGRVLDHVKDAKEYRKIPDDTAQGHWNKTLTHLEAAAKTCIDTARSGSAASGSKRLDDTFAAQTAYHLLSLRISRLAAEDS
jgi:hypothetical protein